MISKLIKAVLGLAFILVGLWAVIFWWGDLLILVRGGIGLFLILLGLIALALIAD